MLASWGQLRMATDRERQAETEVPPEYRNKKTFETRGKRKVDDISEEGLPDASDQDHQANADNQPADNKETGKSKETAQINEGEAPGTENHN